MKYYKHETAIVHEGARIGEGTRIWAHTNIQDGAFIGKDCNICDGSFVEKGARLGNHVTVKHNVSIFDGVTIEDDCFIASNIAFINDRNPRSNREDEWLKEETLIKKGATLGANAVILCGITVGEYAVVAAGSVVTKDVPPFTIVMGNPAKEKGLVCICGRSLDERLRCSCGKKYKRQDESLALDE